MPASRAFKIASSWAWPWWENRSPVPKVYLSIFSMIYQGVGVRCACPGNCLAPELRPNHLTFIYLLRACQAWNQKSLRDFFMMHTDAPAVSGASGWNRPFLGELDIKLNRLFNLKKVKVT